MVSRCDNVYLYVYINIHILMQKQNVSISSLSMWIPLTTVYINLIVQETSFLKKVSNQHTVLNAKVRALCGLAIDGQWFWVSFVANVYFLDPMIQRSKVLNPGCMQTADSIATRSRCKR